MSEERQRILRMLKDGRLTVDEAEALLEAIGEEALRAEPAPAEPEGQPPAWETPAEELAARQVDVDRLVEDTARPDEAGAGHAEARREHDEARAGDEDARARREEARFMRDQERARPDEARARRDEEQERRTEWRSVVDDIIASVDVEGIVESVRESIRQARPDVERLREGIRDEVRRATRHAREEARRAVDEARRAAREHMPRRWVPKPPKPPKPPKFGIRIARAIEGLWGLSDATGEWSYEGEVPAGKTVSLRNVWGDVTLEASGDGRLHVQARTRAWGRDPDDARANLDQIRITAQEQGDTVAIGVDRPLAEHRVRFRVDFDVQVPAGVAVDVSQAKGDVSATRLSGALRARTASGDVTVEDQAGPVEVESASGDLSLAGVQGDVQAQTAHGDGTVERVSGDVSFVTRSGDVSLVDVGGRASVKTMSGDVSVERVRGDVELQTYGGDVDVVEAGGAVTVATMGGDVELERVGGTVTAHSKGGDVSLSSPAGPLGFELSTLGGDVEVEVDRFVPGSASSAKTAGGDVTVRLGPDAGCRISARTATGSVSAEVPLAEAERGRRSLRGTYGGGDATLDLSTAAGDVSIERGS